MKWKWSVGENVENVKIVALVSGTLHTLEFSALQKLSPSVIHNVNM